MVAQHEARRAHRSRREKVSGGRRSAQVVCSSVPHSHVTARALVRLARSMGFQGQIRPSHSVREPGRRCHDAQRRRTRAPAVPTIFKTMRRPCLHVGDVRNAHLGDGLSAARLVSPGASWRQPVLGKRNSEGIHFISSRHLHEVTGCREEGPGRVRSRVGAWRQPPVGHTEYVRSGSCLRPPTIDRGRPILMMRSCETSVDVSHVSRSRSSLPLSLTLHAYCKCKS